MAQSAEHDRALLAEWLAGIGFELDFAQPLTGDVSLRRYERLTAVNGSTAVLAHYPEELRETCHRFARTTGILADARVPVPEILCTHCARGWMLLQDLGDTTLADLRDREWSELAAWFETAAALATRIAALPSELVHGLSPPLDRDLMLRELDQTRRLFLEPRGLVRPVAGALEAGSLPAALDVLCATLAADPPVPCHRDYMARNLVPNGSATVVVLDHQDLRLGPPAYDLASLLNDTLFPPPELEHRLVAAAFPGTEGRLRYHRAAAQRTLKAVGSYAAFAHRGFARHLPLVGPTLRRFLSHFSRVPEGERLAPDLERAWAGVLAG